MRSRIFPSILLASLISLLTWFWTPPAFALIPVKISDLSLQNCPAELSEGMISSFSSQSANCYLIVGKAKNTSGKYIVDADVFGRIYDVNGNRVMENRTRLGSISEVPPGETDFEIRISIPTNLKPPFSLEKFKASGFKNPIGR